MKMFFLSCVFGAMFAVFYTAPAFAHPTDTLTLNNTNLLYHKVKSQVTGKKNLVIYLHGGVSQFKDIKQPVGPSPSELLEGNSVFLDVMNEKGYDIIMPIAYGQYNWLEGDGAKFIGELLRTYRAEYEQVYIAGFSDGGTGAFRLFYDHPERYDGVMVFNGYPQLNNYYKKVDHFKAIGKKIIYASTSSDKVIPYEFLLVEFRRQQMLNEHTYFILRDGGHDFRAYKRHDFELCLQLLEKQHSTSQTPERMQVYPPIDGLVVDGKVKEVYSFRKKVGKGYSMTQQEYMRKDWSAKEYAKLLAEGYEIELSPVDVNEQQVRRDESFSFDVKVNGRTSSIQLTNWVHCKTW